LLAPISAEGPATHRDAPEASLGFGVQQAPPFVRIGPRSMSSP
jgi:hypothetical protein